MFAHLHSRLLRPVFFAVFGLLVFLACLPHSAAQQGSTRPSNDGLTGLSSTLPSNADTRRLRELVKQLGDADFRTREAADRDLGNVGESARVVLDEASHSAEPEVAIRALGLLRRLDLGLGPDMPVELVAAIEDYGRMPEADRQRLIGEIGMKPRWLPALIILLNLEKNPAVRSNISSVLIRQARAAATALIAAGKIDQARELLKECVAQNNDEVESCCLLLKDAGRMGEALDLANHTEPKIAAKLRTVVYRLQHDPERALAAAQALALLDEPQLLHSIWFERRDAHSLAAAYSEMARKTENEFNLVAYAAYFAYLDRDEKALEGHLKTLRQIAQKDPTLAFGTIKVLLLCRRVDEAVNLEAKQNPADAFRKFWKMLRVADALALLGAPPNDQVDQRVALHLVAAELLWEAGARERAESELAEAQKDRLKIDTEKAGFIYRQYASTLLAMGRREQLIKESASLPTEAQSHVIARLFPENEYASAHEWWQFVRATYPEAPWDQNLARIDRLVQGKPATEEESRWPETARQWASKLEGSARQQASSQIVGLLDRLGRNGEADAIYDAELVKEYDPATCRQAIDRAIKAKNWKRVAELASMACAEFGRDDGNLSISDWPWMLYLRGAALSQIGEPEAGNPLMRRARLMIAAHGWDHDSFVRCLENLGASDEVAAEHNIEELLAPMDDYDRMEGLRNKAYDARENSKFAQAAECLEWSFLSVCRTNSWFSNEDYYLIGPYQVLHWQTQGLMASGNFRAAAQQLRLAMEQLPHETDAFIELYKELKQQGQAQAVEEIFDRLWTVRAAACEALPEAALLHNNIAWLGGCCGRRLDESLVHAERAVKAFPENAAYIDTLAEVHFQLGHITKALQLENEAVRLAPKQEILHRRLEQMMAASTQPASGATKGESKD